MKRWLASFGLVVLIVSVGMIVWRQRENDTANAEIRRTLFAELQPVGLESCKLRRYGEPGDGGYLMCENHLVAIEAAYSYGINGYDQWGCDVSSELQVQVHRYDCFNTENPACATGKAIFHAACIGTEPAVIDGRPFDSLENQIRSNGDSGRRLVVKMDVESAEWDSLLQTPAAVLDRIDQLVVEFHLPRYRPALALGRGSRPVVEQRLVDAIRKLKEHFHVANLHFNNYSCVEGFEPFPSHAFEVLFVSRRVDEVDPAVSVTVPHPLDVPNRPNWPDCQVAPSG